jgi:hypothetical protein
MERSSLQGLHLPLLLARAKQHRPAEQVALTEYNRERTTGIQRTLVLTAG